MDKNCTNCRLCTVRFKNIHGGYSITEKELTCWYHPNSIAEPTTLNQTQALNFVCDKYISLETKLCRDCKCYRGDAVADVCMNIKNTTVTTEGLIIPEEINLNQKACTYFIPRDEE